MECMYVILVQAWGGRLGSLQVIGMSQHVMGYWSAVLGYKLKCSGLWVQLECFHGIAKIAGRRCG